MRTRTSTANVRFQGSIYHSGGGGSEEQPETADIDRDLKRDYQTTKRGRGDLKRFLKKKN
jgi:hypothetical protein